MTSGEALVAVSAGNLSSLAALLPTPKYDRRALKPRTVHIGVGAFNRAHQAVYLDDLLHMADTERWAECGIGLMPSDEELGERLTAQDYLYTLVERSATTRRPRLIGSICGYIFAPKAHEAAIEAMASPECRIVSMTITEGGYLLDAGTGQFRDTHPNVLHDLEHPAHPKTFLGFVSEALERRRVRGLPPFTVLSCDNLQGNGDVTRYVFSSFAELRSPELRQWMERNVAFPNSMVDRITPATTPVEREQIQRGFGIRDEVPVITEPFRQWVIEDTFSNGRPAWDLAGAQFTGEVVPFELMKMRLLNGGHFAIAYIGALLGYEFVHEILEDPLLRRFLIAFMEEVAPVVPPLPGIDLAEYRASLIERFSNPAIRDQVTRIAGGGPAKIGKFILPSVLDLFARGKDTRLLSFTVASWLQYMKGTDESGRPLSIADPLTIELRTFQEAGCCDPRPALAVRSLFGDELPHNQQFVEQVESSLTALSRQGVRSTLQRLLSEIENP